MQLPASPEEFNISVPLLSSCFKSKTATYKFYWLLSIIEAVEENKEVVDKRELFARMIANAWYTVNYFKVSFGQHDKLHEAIQQLHVDENLSVSAKKEVIVHQLLHSTKKSTQAILKHFDNNVPFKFLSPWLGTFGKPEMYRLSQANYNYPPYALYPDWIAVQPDWVAYFKRNAGMLKDFCYWNLALFLQARNPNVPDIPNKLMRPHNRGSLSLHKRDFWDLVIHELGHVNCIYTHKELHKGTYAVEHFVPFQFVAHDLMWNLIPADPSFNSIKGAKLPHLDTYFSDFFDIQQEAVKIVQRTKPSSKFLQEYLTVFPDLHLNKDKYRECLEPMLMIAQNNGFQYMK